jgi:hypothetical protein
VGPAVALIDHVTKAAEGRGRYAIGAQHKLAGIDGAAYLVELVKPFGHGKRGLARVTVAKDRGGRVRQHAEGDRIAELHLRSEPDGSVFADLTSPRSSDEPFRPTVLMSRVSEALLKSPQPLPVRGVLDRVKGRAEDVRRALAALVDEGYVVREQGANRSQLHRLERPFIEDGS